MAKRGVQRRTRPQSDADLLAVLARTTRRLDDGIAGVASNDPEAFEKLASALRLLVGSGRGNQLLFRLANRLRIQLPHVTMTFAIPDDPTVVMAVGAMPLDPTEDEHAPPHSTITLSGLMAKRCLVVSHRVTEAEGSKVDEQESFTWDELVSMVANKFVMHADDDVPVVLDEIKSYEVNGRPVIPFALRGLSVLTSRAAHFLLAAADASHEPVEHPLAIEGVEVSAVIVRRGPSPGPR